MGDDVAMTSMMNRRSFLRTLMTGVAAAPFAAHGWRADAADGEGSILFVGTQTIATSKGIYAYRWNSDAGQLTALGLAAWADSPTFLALSPENKYLYACNEISTFGGAKSGGVSAFSVSSEPGKLTFIDAVPAMGTGTTNVTIDHTGRAVFCANYDSGSTASFRVEASGGLSQAVSHFQYQGHGLNHDRQEAPHAHRVTVSPDNRFMLVNDLGLDCIHIYKLDAATAVLTPNTPAEWKSEPGVGPRALRFHPNGRWAYCIEEMACAVAVLRWDAKAGSLTTVQRVSIRTEGFSGATTTGSEIVITRNGDFAYAADRGDDTLTSFRVDPATGKLTFLGRTSCGGKIPRHIALDPTEKWLLVANQVSDDIAVIRRDAGTGLLADKASNVGISKPQCLLFL
jgi:6-phosphogluconolactonase